MKAIAFALMPLALLSTTAQVQESELGGKLRAGQEVVVAAGETVQGDLYASARTVRIDGRVDGDVVAAGGRVTVAGTVTGDVLAGAGTVTISGQVDGDVRAGAGQARVTGQVGEDLLLGTGQATVASGARVGGDLIFSSGQMRMDGAVAGSVLGRAGTYARGGTVAGGERVAAPAPERPPTLAERAAGALRRYVGVLAVGLLLLWLAGRVLDGAAAALRQRPLPSLGIGALGIIAAGVLVVVVMIVTILVALVLGLLGLAPLAAAVAFAGVLVIAVVAFVLWLAAAFGAQVVVGLALGRLLFPGGARPLGRALGALALGLLVVVVLVAVPLVGPWVELLVLLLGLGALVLALRAGDRRRLAGRRA